MRSRGTALAAFVLTACSADRDETHHAMRDSVGIRIVESSRPAWHAEDAWEVAPASLVIGANGGELHRVAGATRLADGTIVIANAGTAELLVFGPDGTRLRTIGRRGEGPGEFAGIAWLGRSADTLLVWDHGLMRISAFTPDGTHVRNTSPSLPDGPMTWSVHGSLADGRMLLGRGISFVPVDGEAGVQRQPLSMRLISSDGRVGTEYGPFPGESVFLKAGRRSGSVIRTPVPFGPATLVRAGADRILVADNGAFEIHVYDLQGDLASIIRRPYERVPIGQHDVAAYVEERLALLPPVPEIREGIRAAIEQVPLPDWMPAIRSLLIDSEAHVWAEVGRTIVDEPTWSVFDAGGIWQGDVTTPAGFTPLEIGSDYILALARDEMEVEAVVLLPLRRGAVGP